MHKGGQRHQGNNDFQDWDLVVHNQDKIHLIIITIVHQTIINQITHLQMRMVQLILVMMTYHSNERMRLKI